MPGCFQAGSATHLIFFDSYRDIERGFQENKEETIHGSLLAIGAFVRTSGNYVSETFYFEAVLSCSFSPNLKCL
jgi:hypothetical protein